MSHMNEPGHHLRIHHMRTSVLGVSFVVYSTPCVPHTQVGYMWESMLRAEVCDEREMVMGYLAVERARGRESPLAPWIDALPRE